MVSRLQKRRQIGEPKKFKKSGGNGKMNALVRLLDRSVVFALRTVLVGPLIIARRLTKFELARRIYDSAPPSTRGLVHSLQSVRPSFGDDTRKIFLSVATQGAYRVTNS